MALLPRAAIEAVLAAMPKEWKGTTFNNSNLLGRAAFIRNLSTLLNSCQPITATSLAQLGQAEDYARVATNVSTMLEAYLAQARCYDVDHVFTFASAAMPVVAVLMTCEATRVHLYHGDEAAPFGAAEVATLSVLGAELILHAASPPPLPTLADGVEDILIALDAAMPVCKEVKRQRSADGGPRCFVHAVVAANVLYIADPRVISPDQIGLVRKRFATPATTPMAEAALRLLSSRGSPIPQLHQPVARRPSPGEAYPVVDPAKAASSEPTPTTDGELAELSAHLQSLCGTCIDMNCPPLICTAGLPALASLWVSLLHRDGAEVVMCSTAYGGSSQLTGLLAARTAVRGGRGGGRIRQHSFSLEGSNVVDSIATSLTSLAAAKRPLLPTTIIFLEAPTNPEMKLPELSELVRAAIHPFAAVNPTDVILLIDTTLAPCSRILEAIAAVDPQLPTIAFISLSKSVSRGLTTTGALVANRTPRSRALVHAARSAARALDTFATPDQLRTLADNHQGVEDRCRKAYEVARAVGDALCASVRTHTLGIEMELSFITPEQAASGYHTSTFSFNLPSPAGSSATECAGLAQHFVGALTTASPHLFKPCVSFGQDNATVYCTVPATSTQGAIRDEDKARQAVGGVQLVRLSFPPSIDVRQVCAAIDDALEGIYSGGCDERRL